MSSIDDYISKQLQKAEAERRIFRYGKDGYTERLMSLKTSIKNVFDNIRQGVVQQTIDFNKVELSLNAKWEEAPFDKEDRQLTAEDILQLRHSLSQNLTIHTIFMTCNLHEAECKELAALIQNNSRIKKLYLFYRFASHNCMEILNEAFQSNFSLIEVEIRPTNLSETTVLDFSCLTKYIQRNSDINKELDRFPQYKRIADFFGGHSFPPEIITMIFDYYNDSLLAETQQFANYNIFPKALQFAFNARPQNHSNQSSPIQPSKNNI